jgi:hypothetical protein
MKNALTTLARVAKYGGHSANFRFNIPGRLIFEKIMSVSSKSLFILISGEWYLYVNTGKVYALCLFLCLSTLTHLTAQTMVIDEIFGGGGNNGAPYNRDFVILKNMGSQAQHISGWTLQYASASGNFNSMVALDGWINPGDLVRICYYTGTNGSPLPFSCDFTSSTNLAAVNGKLALSTDNTLINSQPGSVIPGTGNHQDVADFVGYGNANQYETEAAPAGSALYGLKRWQETNHNLQDFAPQTPLPADFSLSEAYINTTGEAIILLELQTLIQGAYVEVLRSQDGIFYHPLQHTSEISDQNAYTTVQIIDPQPLAGNSFYKLAVINNQQITTYEFIVKCSNKQINRLPAAVITCKDHCTLNTGTESPGKLSIFTMNGNLIRQVADCLGNMTFEITGMPKGTYVARYQSAEMEKTWMLLVL